MYTNRTVGTFTISLDFELYWGMRDVIDLEAYRNNLMGVWKAVPEMLALFEQYDIHVTWATVGFLWHKDTRALKASLPTLLPAYKDTHLCPYRYVASLDAAVLEDESFLKMHFAKPLIDRIACTPHQEIATHSYSHYYTREPKIIPEAFDADLAQAYKTGEENGHRPLSLVFPRNQIDRVSLGALKRNGIRVYRGNPEHWAYKEGETNKTFLQRVYRFADIYMNLSGYHTTSPAKDKDGVMEAKSSMFLRPWSKKFAIFEALKRKRIKDAMHHAAKNRENFHLWWHPHNFGINLEENLKNLEEILRYYQHLNREYGMVSMTMNELGESV